MKNAIFNLLSNPIKVLTLPAHWFLDFADRHPYFVTMMFGAGMGILLSWRG